MIYKTNIVLRLILLKNIIYMCIIKYIQLLFIISYMYLFRKIIGTYKLMFQSKDINCVIVSGI